MNTEKPKLTEEQFKEIEAHQKIYGGTICEAAMKTGYMEKPETPFERAERLWREYTNGVTDDTDIDSIREIINAFREAIAEPREPAKMTEQDLKSILRAVLPVSYDVHASASFMNSCMEKARDAGIIE